MGPRPLTPPDHLLGGGARARGARRPARIHRREAREPLWGWSPQLAGFVGEDPAAQRLREHGAERDLPALTTEELEYFVAEDQDKGEVIADLAHDVGRIGLEVFGPGALYYTFPIGGGSRGCVLVRDIPVELPPVRIEAIATLLGRAAGNIDDLAWSFDGLARLQPGWSASTEQAEGGDRVEVLADEQGRRLAARTTRDELGRITQLKVTIEGHGAAATVDPKAAGARTSAAPSSPQPAPLGGGLLARVKGFFGG